jgi:hypothetical protein
MSEAEVLSHARRRAIQPLTEIRQFNGSEASASVRAAALIGGPDSLRLLARMAQTTAENTAAGLPGGSTTDFETELVRAWNYFDTERYAELVLKPACLRTIEVSHIKQLDSITEIPTLDCIMMHGFIADNTDLSILGGTEISEVDFIGGTMRRLTETLREWLSVRTVRFSSCSNLATLDPLYVIPNLESLRVLYCRNLTDYSAIGNLTNLKRLQFQGQSNIDLGVLANLPNLRNLRFSYMPRVDLTPLSGKPLDIILFHVNEVIYPASTAGQTYRITGSDNVARKLSGEEFLGMTRHYRLKDSGSTGRKTARERARAE